MEVSEEMLTLLAEQPEAALKALDPEMAEKCSKICGKTAAKGIEMLEDH